MEFFAAADRQPQPWRNGGGVTREIAAGPLWRLSIAEIAADGPFSAFPEYQRVLTLTRGNGIRLRLADQAHQISRRYQVFAFDGATPAECTLLDGPVSVLNVFVARSARSPLVQIYRLGGPFPLTSNGPTALICLDGSLSLGSTALSALDAVVVDGGRIEVAPDRAAVLAQVTLPA